MAEESILYRSRQLARKQKASEMNETLMIFPWLKIDYKKGKTKCDLGVVCSKDT